MKVTKLRCALAAVLVLLPAVTFNASALQATDTQSELGAPQPTVGWCWIFVNGRWWYVPC